MRIAICDDNLYAVDIIKTYIEQYIDEKELEEIVVYENGSLFLSAVISERVYFDLIFLDIDMPYVTGLDVAKIILENSKHIHIIFVTNIDNLVFEAVQYQPIWYVRKSLMAEEMPRALECFLKRINKKEREIVIINKGIKYTINFNNILYMEAEAHYINIIMFDSTIRIRGSIKEYESRLPNSQFIKCHRGFIVNIKHISRIFSRKILLLNNIEIPVSRNKYKEVFEKYMEMIRNNYYG